MLFKLTPFKTEFTITRLANIQYFDLLPNYRTEQDKHPFHELIFVDNGSINVSSENYTGKLSKNEMILHPANTYHSFSTADYAPNISIIGFECDNFDFSALTKAPVSLNSKLKEMLTIIINEGRNVFLPPYDIPGQKNMPKKENFEFGADQIIKNLLEIFLVYCLREEKSQNTPKIKEERFDAFVSPIKNYIDINFTKGISLNVLCQIFNTNKTTICKEFKAFTGLTISAYINVLRIDYTKKLLREAKYSLTEIADMMNLSSVHYLTALFKKSQSISPSQYITTIKSKFN